MQLTKREKAVVLGGLGGLTLLMAIQFVVRPTMEHISTLRRVVKDKREVLAQVRAKNSEYRNLRTEIDHLRSKIARQQEDHGILSTMEGIRKACDLPDDALSLKPATMQVGVAYRQTTVEVRLEGVTLAQLIDFLSQVDSLDLAGGIKSLDIRIAERGAGLLRAVIQVTTVTSIEPV